jgi:hypothetical protein
MSKKHWKPREYHQILRKRIIEILNEYSEPMTVRQMFYQLVGRFSEYPNNHRFYEKQLNYNAERARKAGDIPFDSFIDPTRQLIKNNSWKKLQEFIDDVPIFYNKDKWKNQKIYLEVWLEKDTLLGIFEDICEEYDVPLLSGHGQFSLSCLNEASKRYNSNSGTGIKPADCKDIWEVVEKCKKRFHILYFGDYDPEGEDIPRNCKQRLKDFFGINAFFDRIALNEEDIEKYNLPPKMSEKQSSLREKFESEHDIKGVVELDALPPNVLRDLAKKNIVANLNRAQFNRDLENEKKNQKKLFKIFSKIRVGNL